MKLTPGEINIVLGATIFNEASCERYTGCLYFYARAFWGLRQAGLKQTEFFGAAHGRSAAVNA